MDLQEAEIKYPVPEFVQWYVHKFPKRQFIIIATILFALGFLMTILELPRLFIAMPTFLLCGLILIGGSIHTVTWYMMRCTLRKRAKFLNLSFKEYIQKLEYGE